MSDLLDVINKLKEEKKVLDATKNNKTKASRDHATSAYASESGRDCSGVAGLHGVFGYFAERSTFR